MNAKKRILKSFAAFALICGLSVSTHAQTCATATVGGTWQNTAMTSQTGTFTATFDATPSASPTNSVIALSNGAQTAYASFACLARFNPTGQIDAYNGSASGYAAASAINYSAGVSYHFRLVVNVSAQTYSVYVTPAGGSELAVGTNFAFRISDTTLNYWGVYVSSSSGGTGTDTVCNFSTGTSPSQAATPSFNPAPGTYSSAQSVAITTGTSGASIRYTTDGSTPTETAGTLYSGPVSIGATTTIKAIAYASGYTDSTVASGAYTISTPPPQVTTPAFSPGAGTYTSAQNVSINDSTSGASIRYTTDGSTPTSTTGTIYSGAVNISSTTTLKAIAYETGFTNSNVASATFTISAGSGGTLTGSSGDGFHALAISPALSGTFTATFDATPTVSPENAVVGLSSGAATAYGNLACIARFNPTGQIDAYNGTAYAAASTINYSANVSYHFRLVVNVTAHTYSVYVTPAGGAELTVGLNYAFRSTANTMTSLGDWNLDLNSTPSGCSLTAKNLSGTGGGTTCTTVPAVPTGLASPSQTGSSVSLSWNTVGTPAGCSVSYNVYNGGSLAATVGANSAVISGLSASTTYSFTVAASDSAGSSSQSPAISVTTSASSGNFTPAQILAAVQSHMTPSVQVNTLPHINTMTRAMDVNVYQVTPGVYAYTSSMAIDDDGSDPNPDPDHQNQTTWTDSSGAYLGASHVPYYVLGDDCWDNEPKQGGNFHPCPHFFYQDRNITGLQFALIFYNGNCIGAVFGDTQGTDVTSTSSNDSRELGEASVESAFLLGIPDSGTTGGVDNGVTVVIFSGPQWVLVGTNKGTGPAGSATGNLNGNAQALVQKALNTLGSDFGL